MKLFYTAACFWFIGLLGTSLFGQNGIIGSGFTNGWNNSADVVCFDSGVGSSRIKILNANGTGNQYFRIVRCWDYGFGNDYTEHTAQGQVCTFGNDLNISGQLGTPFDLQGCNQGAFYVNVGNTSHNYVFKTPTGDGAARFLVFRVRGAVRTINSVTTGPPDCADVDKTIRARMNGDVEPGQGVYIRYTNDNFATATIAEMNCFRRNCFFSMPDSVNTVGSTVSYYVFTSGEGLTIPDAERDFYAININNNGGSNYNYVVPPAFEVEAGNPVTVCNGGVLNLADLAASISGNYSNGGTEWTTSGTGTFDGDETFDNSTTYTPSPADMNAGGVLLKLVAGIDSPCYKEDTVIITFGDADCGSFPWDGN